MANETILIVDADTKSQKVLEVSLKKAGYRVLKAESPSQGWDLVRTSQPEIIIAETRFSDGSGFDLLEQIKASEKHASIPFVFLTEERSLPSKMRGFELGAEDYLTKPVYIKEVTTRVELLLQKRARSLLTESEVEEFEGKLTDITMIDLLQTIEEEERSGSVHLERQRRRAVVYFREGNILDAICGKLQGEEAIYRLLMWPDGDFIVRYHEASQRSDRIQKDSGRLLLEGIRRLEWYSELVDNIGKLTTVFESDYPRVSRMMSELPLEVASVVRLFDGMRTLQDIVEDSPVDDVTTLQIIKKLQEDDLLLDVTPRDSAAEAPPRSNLQAWLEGVRGRLDLNVQPSRTIRDTSPGLRPSEDAPVRKKPEVDAGWNIHFDTPDPEGELRRIEEAERVRREEEARRLASSNATLPMVASIDRATGEQSVPEEAARVAVDEEEDAPVISRTGTDKKDGDITAELHRGAVLEAVEERRRKRLQTPISTPVRATLVEEDKVPERVVETDEVEFERDGTDPGSPVSLASRRAESVEAAEELAHQVSDQLRESAQLEAVSARESESPDPTESGQDDVAEDTAKYPVEVLEEREPVRALGDQVSESDVFDDDPEEVALHEASEPLPDIDPRADTGEVEVPPTERETRKLGKVELTPLGQEESDPEAIPGLDEVTAPGDRPPRRELQEPPPVERCATDGEVVRAEYELGPYRPGVRATISRSEQETEELPREADSSEEEGLDSAFFASAGIEEDFEYYEEKPRQTWIWVAVVLCLILFGYFVYTVSQPGDPVLEAVVDEPETKTVVVAPEPEPEPEPVAEHHAVDPDFEGAASGQDVYDVALDLTTALAGIVDEPLETVQLVEEPEPEPQVVVEPVAEPTTPDPVVERPKVEPEVEAQPKEPAARTVQQRISEAERMVARERFQDAMALLRELSEEDPQNGRIAYLYGQAAFSTNRNREAIEQFNRAERLGHRPAGLYLDLAAAHQLSGNRDRARAAYERYLELQPSGRQADEVRAILQSQF